MDLSKSNRIENSRSTDTKSPESESQKYKAATIILEYLTNSHEVIDANGILWRYRDGRFDGKVFDDIAATINKDPEPLRRRVNDLKKKEYIQFEYGKIEVTGRKRFQHRRGISNIGITIQGQNYLANITQDEKQKTPIKIEKMINSIIEDSLTGYHLAMTHGLIDEASTFMALAYSDELYEMDETELTLRTQEIQHAISEMRFYILNHHLAGVSLRTY